jgi:hypothetical protein
MTRLYRDRHAHPGVHPDAVRADPGGQPLPGPGRQALRSVHRPAASLCRSDAPVAGDGQDVPDFPALKGAAQDRVGAVNLVAGDPARGHTGVQRGGDHVRRQRRFGREGDVGRHPRAGAPVVRRSTPAPGRIRTDRPRRPPRPRPAEPLPTSQSPRPSVRSAIRDVRIFPDSSSTVHAHTDRAWTSNPTQVRLCFTGVSRKPGLLT